MFIKIGMTVINSDRIIRADFTPLTTFKDNSRTAIPAQLKLSLAGRTELMYLAGETAEETWELISAKAEVDGLMLARRVMATDDAEDDEEIEFDDVFGVDDRVGIPGMTLDSATQAD